MTEPARAPVRLAGSLADPPSVLIDPEAEPADHPPVAVGRVRLGAAAWALACVIASSVHPQWTQLSPTYLPGQGVDAFQITPDEQWVLFTAFDESPECATLYRVPLVGSGTGEPGSTVERIGRPAFAECEISFREFTGDGERLIYSVYRGGPSDLHSVEVSAPTPTEIPLLTSLVEGQELALVEILGSSVVALIYESGEQSLRLVPASGPEAAAVTVSDDVHDVRFSVVAQRMVYRDGGGLFSRGPGLGDTPIRLDQAVRGAGNVSWFRLSPDGSRVAFAMDSGAGTSQIHVVAMDGPASSAVRIDEALPGGETLPTGAYFEFSEDGDWALVHTFVSGSPAGGALYSVATDGLGPMRRLDQAPGQKFEFGFTPGGDVLFLARQESLDRTDLYSVPRAGPSSAAHRLNEIEHFVSTHRLLSDGDTIVYRAEGEGSSRGQPIQEYFRVSSSAPSDVPYRLSGLGLETRVEVTGDGREIGSRWVYTGYVDGGDERELFSVLVQGNRERSAVRLNSNPDQAQVVSFQGLDEDRWIAFRDRPLFDEQGLVMMVDLAGVEDAVSTHSVLPPWFEVGGYRVAASRGVIAYTLRAGDPTPQGDTLFMRRIPWIFADGFESGDGAAWGGLERW